MTRTRRSRIPATPGSTGRQQAGSCGRWVAWAQCRARQTTSSDTHRRRLSMASTVTSTRPAASTAPWTPTSLSRRRASSSATESLLPTFPAGAGWLLPNGPASASPSSLT